MKKLKRFENFINEYGPLVPDSITPDEDSKIIISQRKIQKIIDTIEDNNRQKETAYKMIDDFGKGLFFGSDMDKLSSKELSKVYKELDKRKNELLSSLTKKIREMED